MNVSKQYAGEERGAAAKKESIATRNRGVNPAVGNILATVRTKEPGEGESPYHAAAVVAKDGLDLLTLEQTAGDNDAETEPLQLGTFDFYTVGDGENSFYDKTKSDYKNGVVTVLTANSGAHLPAELAEAHNYRSREGITSGGKKLASGTATTRKDQASSPAKKRTASSRS